jgi:hypothetical protein
MVNLCKGNHCVREALEKDGWVPDDKGGLKKVNTIAPRLDTQARLV